MGRFCFLILLLVSACGSDSGTAKTKHALVIGIDGLRSDALQQVSTPAIDGLIAEGTVTYDAFAGGVLGTPTEQMTWSGAGWSSILTGVWVDKHGVELNTFDDARFDEYPHFFARVREEQPDAYLSSFVTWGPINESILASAEVDEEFWPNEPNDPAKGDAEVTAAVATHLAARTPHVVFVQLDNVDHEGHVAGFSPTVPEYVEALEVVDAQIGQMVDAVQARPTFEQEDWLIVLTTDHGGMGKAHGPQGDEERTIFIIVSGGSARRGHTITPGPGHTAIPPTVMTHLGLPIDPAWGWESEPFGL
jgi:predicted AlkP superfamily pyrophosphatase or phosphodiesterase